MNRIIGLLLILVLFTSCWPKVKVEQALSKNDKYKYAYIVHCADMNTYSNNPEVSTGLVDYLFDDTDFIQNEGMYKYYIMSNKNIFNIKDN